MKRVILTAFLLCFLVWNFAEAETVLTIDKVRQIALEYNRQYLSAQQEIDRSQGAIISARAGALPELTLSSRYTRNLKNQELFFGGQKVPIGLNNEFDVSLSLSQPLYVGGKVGAALQIAKMYKSYTHEKLREVKAAIIFSAESIFYNAILAESNRDVLQKAYEQLSYNLQVVEKYFNQGMSSEYELLRARVEKANLEPQLIGAESEVTLSRKRLKSFLGLRLDEDIRLDSNLGDSATLSLPPLDTLVAQALQNRPEVKQADYQKRVYDKAIRIAKGGWLYPVVSLNTTYNFTGSADDFRYNRQNTAKSWSASFILSIPLFDGGRTIGEVRQARVDYYQAMLSEKQTLDDVRLEVEQTYDNLNMARKALDMQKETIAQAEEGMRIADVRYQSGVGTQLEVLSAQTALTDARTNLSRATYNYRLAKAALKKAISEEIDK
ncbi:MAG: TolC family protein [candidate division Zixibacteria bacterium]|nr:TolC family protein [candidate division Zixibacteria bacterium]